MPLRLEIGPKDIEKKPVFAARRDTREKASIPMDGLAAHVSALLDEIQAGAAGPRARSSARRTRRRRRRYDEFKQIMDGRPGFVISPWCGSDECEAQIKAETQATIRNIPFGLAHADGAVHPVRPAGDRECVVRQGLLRPEQRLSG